MISTFKQKIWLTIFLIFTIVFFISCSTGKTTVETISYYAVPSDDNINYYRVKIQGKSKLSKLKYKSGWYPTLALDQLFGNITSDESQDALEVQNKLKRQFDTAILETNSKYLDAAKDTSVSNEELLKFMEARNRVLAYSVKGPSIPYAVEMEYNPLLDFVVSHSNKKFAIILSANPDEVVSKISSFAESDKTTAEISKLSKLFEQQYINNYYAIKSESEIKKKWDQVIHNQLGFLKNSANTAAKTGPQLVDEINALIKVLEELK